MCCFSRHFQPLVSQAKVRSHAPVFGALLLSAIAVQIAGAEPALMEMHGDLRQRVVEGRDTSGPALSWRQKSGDFSFESFLDPTPALRSAMRLQTEAIALWDAQRLDKAVQAYRKVSRLLSAQHPGEAAFCHYFIAEIRASQGRFGESLLHANRGLSLLGPRDQPKPFLRGLLLHTQGYVYWMAGQPDLGIRRFGQAQAAWEKLGFDIGTLTVWANLALLYEELDLAEKAELCYRQALLQLSSLTEVPEISFQLYSNYARFLTRSGRHGEAHRFLDRARQLQNISPFEFRLLEHEIAPTAQTLAALEAAHPKSLPQRIERELLLAATDSGDDPATRFRQALDWCKQSGNLFLRWRALEQFGAWLESEGRDGDAETLYAGAFEEASVGSTDLLYPFSRIQDPFLDGLVRTRLRLGEEALARKTIHSVVRQRRRRTANQLQAVRPNAGPPQSEIDRLVVQSRRTRLWVREQGTSLRTEALVSAVPSGYTKIELWPDGRHIYAWIDSIDADKWLTLNTDRPVASLIGEAVSPLYQTGDILLRRPAKDLVAELSASLIWPLIPHISTRKVALVPHKELQHLPFELLIDQSGTLLLDRFVISYLPPAAEAPVSARGRPIAVLPQIGPEDLSVREEAEHLAALFPEIRVVGSPGDLEGSRADWVHLSSHFFIDSPHWSQARFESVENGIGVWQFLRQDFRSQLLSVGACDVGNRFSWLTPFWMGVADVLLKQHANAVVVSRWKLEEETIDIYLDFYRRVRQGTSLDVALTQAKRRFRAGSTRTGSAPSSGRHPFYWAGLTYVGPPGMVLYPVRRPPPFFWILLTIKILWVLVVWRQTASAKGGTANPNGVASKQPESVSPW